MRALVTGGAGFIGSHIVDLLIFEGHDVAVVDNLSSGSRSNVNSNARFHQVDVTSVGFERVLRFEHPEVVFHQAAQMCFQASIDDPLHDANVNILGMVNVLEGCVAAGVRKVVFASSGASYGNPIYLPIDENHPQRPVSPDGITKLACEHYLSYYAQAHGLHYTVLRYGAVYGPRQSLDGQGGLIASFAHQLLTGQTPVVYWDGQQARDYVYVADVALANLLSATAGNGRTYCIGTGIGTTLNEVLATLGELIGAYTPPRVAPPRPGDPKTFYFDVSRVRSELGWHASVPLRAGLERTVDSLQPRLHAPRAAIAAAR